MSRHDVLKALIHMLPLQLTIGKKRAEHQPVESDPTKIVGIIGPTDGLPITILVC